LFAMGEFGRTPWLNPARGRDHLSERVEYDDDRMRPEAGNRDRSHGHQRG
jgi:hypothetical protein